MIQFVLLLMLAARWEFPQEDAALMQRILPLTGNDLRCVVVHSRYASGRPRLVVAGIDQDSFVEPGELLLIRLPDALRGHGRVVDRFPLWVGAMELWLIRVIDANDISVVLHTKHPPQGITVRVRNEKLSELADTLPGYVVDLDRDGVPEIVTGFDHGAGRCGFRGSPSIYRLRGVKYEMDRVRYPAFAVARVGRAADDFGFDEEPEIEGRPARRYFLRVHPRPGVESVVVRVDGKRVMPGVPFGMEGICHRITAEAKGRKGAEAWVFLERREPRKGTDG